MASFDPSIISQIPDYAPDPVGATAKAFKLSDLRTQEQSNRMLLADQQKDQADRAKVEQIYKKYGDKIGTPEGNVALAGELAKSGQVKASREAMQFGGEQDIRQLQQAKERLQILHFAADDLGPAAKGMADQLAPNGVLNPQALPLVQAKYQQEVARVLPLLPPQVRGSIPPQLPNDPQQALAVLQKGVANSEQARQMIAMENKARDEARADVRLGLAEKAAGRAEAKEADRRREQTEGIISDDAAQLAVDRILNGEQPRDVLANFGRGKQGAQNITKVQNLLATSAKALDIPAAEISARMIEMKGLVKEEQTEAAISGRIRYAEQEIPRIAPKVIETANKLGRGNFVPWNKLQNLVDKNISNPDLKKLKAYLTTLTNSYDVLGGRGGTDVEKRAHNRELLDSADSPAALKAAVDAIEQEARLSGEAATESMRVDTRRLPGGPSQPNTLPGAGATSSSGWGKATVVGQ